MELLQKAYNRDAYLDFLAGKFNFSKLLSTITTENNDVKSFQQLGTVITSDGKKLPVFEIHIKPNTQLQRNRVQLRNLVAKRIKTEDGALAVYIDDQNEQWRFSFIAIEWSLTPEGVKDTQTASKRFTYFLGKDTKTRTARSRFEPINQQSTLEVLKQAFSVEQLNKDFYKDLYKWYEKAQKQVVFPNDEQAENHIQTSLIRLLTRLLFIWFLKEKKLINTDLFQKEKLQTLIDYNQPSSFYKAILQNLFFATLNKEIIKRSFRTTTNNKANSTNYLVTNIYRYQNYFIDSDKDKIITLFEQTPFLNGGLFECLDREATDAEKQDYDNDCTIRPIGSAIRVDGFSDRADNQLAFDNSLFFNDDETGLIDLFNQYQFTVEESTPLDVEVALDPELLGKVFENLLASYNPETGQQARKATGSFYTPREIVSYMVDESLKQYLKQSVPPDDGDNAFYQERLDDLFIMSDSTGELTKNGSSLIYDKEIPLLIKAISTIKIIDPAVGSGAFPMGILQRLVVLLRVLDPDNQGWKTQKLTELPDLQSIEADLKISEEISDIEAKQKAQQILTDKKQDVIRNFEKQDHNYLRKLYLIESGIYGVDIQPIAIQICKLRFFISLTIEQTTNQDKNNNYGITALPNLETKFIVANSLLPLGEMPWQKGRTLGVFDKGIKELQQQLAEIRHKHFGAKTLITKRKYREQDKALRQQMLDELTQGGITPAVEASMKKIVHWDLYNQNSIADWFNPEWQFGVKEGFDIVIGNPPYGVSFSNQEKSILRKIYLESEFKIDSFSLFILKSCNLIKKKAICSYIIPNTLLDNYFEAKVREKLLKEYQVNLILDLNDKVFDSAVVHSMIFSFLKEKKNEYLINVGITDNLKGLPIQIPNSYFLNEPNFDYSIRNYKYKDFLKKMNFKSLNLNQIIDLRQAIKTGDDKNHITKSKQADNYKKILRGKDIGRYFSKSPNLFVNYGKHLACPRDYKIFEQEKILIREAGNKVIATYDNDNYYIMSSIYNGISINSEFSLKYVLSLLESKLFQFILDLKVFQKTKGAFTKAKIYHYDKLPIKNLSQEKQKPFIDLVDKILEITSQENYDPKNPPKEQKELETKIDEMVYVLYNLTDDEINIIKNEK